MTWAAVKRVVAARSNASGDSEHMHIVLAKNDAILLHERDEQQDHPNDLMTTSELECLQCSAGTSGEP